MANNQPESGVTQSGKASARPDDAVSDLMADHRKVEDLFKQYEAAKEDDGRKQKIYQQIAGELRVHMQVEEEIFYPASRDFVAEQDTVNEAEVEHSAAKDTMTEIDGMSPRTSTTTPRSRCCRR